MQSSFTGLSLIDVSRVKLPEHHTQRSPIKSYVIKAAALYATSFDEALMLDSDNTPLVDPSTLFDGPSYLAMPSGLTSPQTPVRDSSDMPCACHRLTKRLANNSH